MYEVHAAYQGMGGAGQDYPNDPQLGGFFSFVGNAVKKVGGAALSFVPGGGLIRGAAGAAASVVGGRRAPPAPPPRGVPGRGNQTQTGRPVALPGAGYVYTPPLVPVQPSRPRIDFSDVRSGGSSTARPVLPPPRPAPSSSSAAASASSDGGTNGGGSAGSAILESAGAPVRRSRPGRGIRPRPR